MTEAHTFDPGRKLTRDEILRLVLQGEIHAVTTIPKHCLVVGENGGYRWSGIRRVWR